MSFLTTYKPLILSHLKQLLKNIPSEMQIQNRWTTDVFDRFSTFSENGKMARGSIFLFTCKMFGKEIDSDLLNVACGLEIIHATLLIHDDIMDNDRRRRDQDTLYVQYEKLMQKEGIKDPEHLGRSLAISAGDIGFFLGNYSITQTNLNANIKSSLLGLVAKELMEVGLAQMNDCLNVIGKIETESEILSLYTYKAARYTFSLPFMMAAMVCGQDQRIIQHLSELGEEIGTMFQIQDELLGLFGDEKTLGKPVGSDIRENRKTLYKTYLYESVNEDEKIKLNSIFGNNQITSVDIEYVRNSVKKLQIQEKISQLVETLHKKSIKMVEDLPVNNEYKSEIKKLIIFMISRNF